VWIPFTTIPIAQASPLFKEYSLMRRARTSTVVLGSLGLACAVGCGVEAAREASRSPAAEGLALYDAPAAIAGVPLQATKSSAGAGEAIASGSQSAANQGLDRKIIYSAELELAVENFTGVADSVVGVAKQFDAYIADSQLAGSTGENRRGTWKIRVPVARFDEFVNAAKGLGEVIKAGTSSRDVSEEYYDVDARIRNKTKEEERLLQLLEERPGKLEDVIAIERELSRVREELERMQGRMRVLADLTSLTTVELSIVEIRNYQPAEAPTLATRIRRTFGGSLEALQATGEATLLAAVAAGPWLPLTAIALSPAWWFARRRKRLPPQNTWETAKNA
jgi:hypothetical protein